MLLIITPEEAQQFYQTFGQPITITLPVAVVDTPEVFDEFDVIRAHGMGVDLQESTN
jgi:hypothetical protein